MIAPVLRSLPHVRAADRAAADPAAAQRRLLSRLLTKASRTEWGQRFQFSELTRESDITGAFGERVPLCDYSAYRDDVERMRRGVRDIAWPGRIRYFAVSSGTASSGKLIPMSDDMMRSQRSFILGTGLRYAIATGGYEWLRGRFLTVPGRVERDTANPDTWIGEASGMMYLGSPLLVRALLQAVPRSILFMPGWTKKLEAIVEHTRTRDVRAIAMVPSWAIVLFPMLVDRHNRATGARATCVRDIWPNLGVFFSGAVPLSSYETLMREQIGGDGAMHFIETYGASEGVFSFQSDPAESDMLLHLDSGVYYEFVRMDDESRPPRRFTIGEVERGVRYRMYVSTCAGLWAYALGDVVRFTETEPPRIVVSGRTGDMLDRYGEAVFAEEAREAIERASRDTGSHVREYHVSSVPPSGSRMPGHQWLVEFDVEPADGAGFVRSLDRYLCSVNRHYGTRRECEALSLPEVVQLPAGTFWRWLAGSRSEVGPQSKVPRMSEDRSVADALLRSAETIGEPTS